MPSRRQWETKEQRWEGCALLICDGKSNPLGSGDFHSFVTDIGSMIHFPKKVQRNERTE
jgi:hypothetical protein